MLSSCHDGGARALMLMMPQETNTGSCQIFLQSTKYLDPFKDNPIVWMSWLPFTRFDVKIRTLLILVFVPEIVSSSHTSLE